VSIQPPALRASTPHLHDRRLHGAQGLW